MTDENSAPDAQDDQMPQDGDQDQQQGQGDGDKGEGIDSLPEWARKELTRARKDAAGYRERLRGVEGKLDEIVKTQGESEDAALEEQEKFSELAEKRGSKIKELEPQIETLQGQVDGYVAVLKGHFETRVADWPDEVKALMPDTDDPAALITWADKAQAMVDALASKKNGVPASPNGDKNTPDPELHERAQKAVERQYSRF